MRVRFGQSRSSQDDGLGERDVLAKMVPGIRAMCRPVISLVIAGTAPLKWSATHEVLFLSRQISRSCILARQGIGPARQAIVAAVEIEMGLELRSRRRWHGSIRKLDSAFPGG